MDGDPGQDMQSAWVGGRIERAYAAPPAAAERAPGADERLPDGKRPDLDWIEDVRVTDTVGRGWCARIDGTDIFDDVNRYGCKGSRSFQIASALPSKQEAERVAAEWLDRQRNALPSAPVAGDAQPVELRTVIETIKEGDGFWRSCTRCHELNEGHDTGPYSALLQCHLGNGYSECGGIGAIWDNTDYQAMGDAMARDIGQSVAPQASPAADGRDAKDAARLEFLADQDAQIQSLTLGNRTKYRIGWPDLGEAQSEWFSSPREAIDAAIATQHGEGEKSKRGAGRGNRTPTGTSGQQGLV
ncbi:hypothetical protein [Bordetella trematum]|uniref:hypothetical protein n=1 Tax=Bordetella trematum TaxID=123899 RepID=UPI000F62CF34|nr:hypothetical protein [Bordetella trematum]